MEAYLANQQFKDEIMTSKVDVKIDVNRLLEEKKTRTFTKIVVYTVLGLITLTLCIVAFQAVEGKHCKTSIIEVNMPEKTDTVFIKNDFMKKNNKR